MKQTNISVFIPHYGCTHICSFCNQKTISGHSEPVTEKELESILEGQLENLKDSGTKAQIAFFGGSFTAIDRDYMIRLLTVAKRYTDAYPEQYDGIRCSTRPDCIDEEILGILKSYGMTAIELGAQSMNDEVLTANRRGHTAQDVRRASRLIKQSGFELGLQMMTGLYKDTEQYCLVKHIEQFCTEPCCLFKGKAVIHSALVQSAKLGILKYHRRIYPHRVAVECDKLLCGINAVLLRVLIQPRHHLKPEFKSALLYKP